MSRTAVTALVVVALFVPLVMQAGESSEPTDLSPKQMWQQRLREARQAVAEARARYETASRDYKRMRHGHRGRGEPRAEARAEIEAARKELEAAEQRLEALPEEARRAGVPPGWLREVEDEDEPAAPSP